MAEGLKALREIFDMGYLETQKGWQEDIVAIDDVLIIEKELKELEEHEEILNDYNLTLADFREACLLLAQWKSAGLNWADYEKQKKALEIIKKHIWYYKEQNRFIFVNMDEDGIKDLLKEVLKNE